MGWEWLVMPMLGALIGWATNFLAIRMLFRPKRPLKIWRITVQGVIPLRRDDLTRVVAQTVQSDLLPMDELLNTMDLERYQQEVVDAVVQHVERRVDNQLPGVLPGQLRAAMGGYVRRIVEREVQAIVEDLFVRLTRRIEEDFDIGAIVREKMDKLDIDELEQLVQRVARRELKVIEILGGALGFVIGLFQAALVSLT